MNNITSHPLHTIFPKEGKIGKALTLVSMGMYAYTLGKSAQATYKKFQNNRYKYSITIDSLLEDDLFDSAMRWLTETYPSDDYSNYALNSFWQQRRHIVVGVTSSVGGQVVNLNGVTSYVVLSTEDRQEDQSTYAVKQLKFYFTKKSDLDASVSFLSEVLAGNLNKNDVEVLAVGVIKKTRHFNYVNGTWDNHSAVPRSLDSVILKEGEKESIVSDMDRFLSLRTEYLRVGIPWHRGYLLYGPPGTGKTSISLALSEHIGLTVFILSLSNVRSDNDLLRAVTSISDYIGGYNSTNSGDSVSAVLVLEDIDTIISTNSRESRNNSGTDAVTLGGILNILDGALTPSGMVTIMTTNYRDRVDSALIRPGRVDFELSVGYLDQHQLEQLFSWYFGEDHEFPTPLLPSGVEITPAEISGIVKNFLGDSRRCYTEICAYIAEKSNKIRLDQITHSAEGGITR